MRASLNDKISLTFLLEKLYEKDVMKNCMKKMRCLGFWKESRMNY